MDDIFAKAPHLKLLKKGKLQAALKAGGFKVSAKDLKAHFDGKKTTLEQVHADHPAWKRLTKTKLVAQLKAADLKVTSKEVDDYYKSSDFQQIRKPADSQRRLPLIITAPPRSFQVDIAHMPDHVSKNGGHAYFLLLVDVLSRKAYAYAMLDRSMNKIIGAYTAFLLEAGKHGPINSVSGDDEFNKQAFRDLNAAENIQLYTDVAKNEHISKFGDKLGIVDRCMRTIKKLINDHIDETGDQQWATWLPKVMDDYNSTTLPQALQNQAPEDVYDAPEVSLIQKNTLEREENARRLSKTKTINPGDSVRILLPKGQFDKEGPRWSREVYKVEGRDKYRYKVVGQTRRFKQNDLQVVPAKAQPIPKPAPVVAAVKQVKVQRKVKRAGLKPAAVIKPILPETDQRVSDRLNEEKLRKEMMTLTQKKQKTPEDKKRMLQLLRMVMKLPPRPTTTGVGA